jgi:excisionase family DNA binding protein
MKKSFSTLEVAKYCHVTYRTVANWIDEEKIKSFKTPGGNRKVLREDLIAFLKTQGIPLGNLEQANIKVFVIDDEAAVGKLFKNTLTKQKKFDVEVYTNPQEAMVQVGLTIPDLILLDVSMPNMDGVSFFKAVKKIKSIKNTKIIFCSGVVNKSKLRDDLGSNWKDVLFLKKPVTPDKLIAAVDKIME